MNLVMLATLGGALEAAEDRVVSLSAPQGSLKSERKDSRREVGGEPSGPQILKQVPTTGEPWCFIEQVQNQQGDVGWRYSYVPGKRFQARPCRRCNYCGCCFL